MGNDRAFRRALSNINGAGMLRPGEEQAQLLDLADKDIHAAPAGAINGYACTDCHKVTFIIHRDTGLTPHFLACQVTEDCEGTAESIGYPDQSYVPLRVRNAVTLEWYRPSQEEFELLNEDIQKHVAAGGLVLRPLEEEETDESTTSGEVATEEEQTPPA